MSKNEQPKKVITRIVFKGLELDSLEFLMKQNNSSDINSLLRFLVQKEYNQIKNSILRYGKGGEDGSKKLTLGDKIQNIKAMTAPELEDYIMGIGLLQNYRDDAENFISYHVVPNPDNGGLKVVCQFRKSENKDESPHYESDIYLTIDEIINALKKDKLI